MKELSTEQKAKAYDEAIERAKIWKDKSGMPKDKQGILDTIFPELKESEDEKTKRILHSISSKISFHLRDIFTEEEFQCFDAWSNAWLEKQGQVHCRLTDKEMKRLFQTEYEKGRADAIAEMQEYWSEEDEEHIKSLLERLEGMCKKDATFIRTKFAISEDEDWLKSLRPHSQWKPSDEQMEAINTAINIIGKGTLNGKQLIELQEQLKKLKGE